MNIEKMQGKNKVNLKKIRGKILSRDLKKSLLPERVMYSGKIITACWLALKTRTGRRKIRINMNYLVTPGQSYHKCMKFHTILPD
jgi:hypothetical protein